MAQRGLAPATQAPYGRVARSYLVFLEGRGITHFGKADGASITRFFESLLARWAKSSLYWVELPSVLEVQCCPRRFLLTCRSMEVAGGTE